MLWAHIVLLTILILSLIMLATMLASLWLLVPYVPTPKRVVEHMVRLANLQGQETVYDLGCGDARLLITAKRTYPHITAKGYELPLGVWMLAKFRVFLSRLDITILLKDFRKADLRDANVIFLYLIPEVMEDLQKKLEKELQPGTTVISHGFPLPGREHVLMERCPLPSWHFMRPPKKKGPRIFMYKW